MMIILKSLGFEQLGNYKRHFFHRFLTFYVQNNIENTKENYQQIHVKLKLLLDVPLVKKCMRCTLQFLHQIIK